MQHFYKTTIVSRVILTAAEHNNGMGEFSIKVASATQSSYSEWATRTATITATTGTATATATYSTSPIPTSTSYDYIVVGGGVRKDLFFHSFPGVEEKVDHEENVFS